MYNSTLSENKSQYFIKYQVRKGFDLATTLLIEQLEYWFSRQPDKKQFYKFIEPCKHYLYREGDSWCEEIGITADVFRRIFKKIAVAYKSQGLYQKAQDKFQGKPYASYYNRQTHQTFFIKNYDYDMQQHKSREQTDYSKKFRPNQIFNTSHNTYIDCSQTISQQPEDYPKTVNQQPIYNNDYGVNVDLNTNNINSDTATLNGDYTAIREYIPNDCPNAYPTVSDQIKTSCGTQILQPAAEDNSKNTVYSKPHNAVSSIYKKQRLHSISLKERESVDNFKIKKGLVKERPEVSSKQQAQSKLEDAIGDQMITIWQQCVGDPGLSYQSRRLLTDLHATLREHFEGSLYHWQAYCKKIASSKFLMGEGKAWKLKQGVFLLWAVKGDNIAKINGNAISLGDRAIPVSLVQSKIIAERFVILQEMKQQEDDLRTVQHDIQRLRRSTVRGRIERLLEEDDAAELEIYQGQFEAMIRQGNVTQDPEWIYQRCSEYFNFQGWRQMSREGSGLNNSWWYFRIYLTQIFADQHFKQTQQQMIEDRQCQIEKHLKSLKQRLDQVNVSMKLM